MKLTENSNNNINYLKRHYKTNDINSKYAVRMLHNILKRINVRKSDYIKRDGIYVKVVPNTYFPIGIVDTINNTAYKEYTIKLKKHKYNFLVKLYSESDVNIQPYIKKIKTILLLFIHYKPIHSKKYHNVTIYLTDIPKKHTTVPIKMDNINSGFSQNNHIVIFRRDEWFKVFIHECIHLFEFDFHSHTDFSELGQYFKIDSEILLFEAYTEFWARIINVCIISFDKTFRRFNLNFKRHIKMEQLYSAVTAKKILNQYNMEYTDLLVPNSYTEETNTFCYYILTSLLFYYFDDTISFFVSNNKNILDFNNKKIQLFIDYVIIKHNNPEWLSYMDQLKHLETNNINMGLYEISF